ncbi:transcription elongation factor GreA [Patescibacteria group bacterium]
MTNDKIYLTKGGLKQLKKELGDLMESKRPLLVQRVARAREMGDLSENTEYANAREELSMLDGRIEELEQILSKAKLIKDTSKGCGSKAVKLGCKVTVNVNGETHVYNVVGEWEADPTEKKISHSSPLGKSLIGKKVGEEVEIEAPAGKIVYQIKKIH